MFRLRKPTQPAGESLERPHQQSRMVFHVDAKTLDAAGIVVAAASDRGCIREQNEDYLGVYTPPPGISQERGLLVVLADGMGGHAAGEVASELAVAMIASAFYQPNLAFDAGISSDEAPEAARRLYAGFLAADQAIRRASQRSPEQRGMGCTCIAAALCGDTFTLAHVGDTRAYLIQPLADTRGTDDRGLGTIRQLTADHSFAAELARAGLLAEEDADHSPRRHVVTRALGGDLEGAACIPDVQVGRLSAGDILVLCCDGLWNLVPAEQIASAVLATPLDRASAALVELAKQAGGDDNISLILLTVR